jgi:DNA polymerase III epsilon subunit-like protein
VDLETTGLDPYYHEITEVGAILLNSELETLGTFQSLVRINHLSRGRDNRFIKAGKEYDVFEWTNIDPKDLEAAPTVHEVLDKLLAMVDKHIGGEKNRRDVTLFGQNTQFDLAFLKTALNWQYGKFPFDYHVISLDSIYTAYCLKKFGKLPEKIGLIHICEHFGVTNPQMHRALPDIQFTVAMLKYILEQLQIRQSREEPLCIHTEN